MSGPYQSSVQFLISPGWRVTRSSQKQIKLNLTIRSLVQVQVRIQLHPGAPPISTSSGYILTVCVIMCRWSSVELGHPPETRTVLILFPVGGWNHMVHMWVSVCRISSSSLDCWLMVHCVSLSEWVYMYVCVCVCDLSN